MVFVEFSGSSPLSSMRQASLAVLDHIALMHGGTHGPHNRQMMHSVRGGCHYKIGSCNKCGMPLVAKCMQCEQPTTIFGRREVCCLLEMIWCFSILCNSSLALLIWFLQCIGNGSKLL